jgi:hypothetical protein
MAGFETTFQEQAFPLLLEQFGETVVYRPLNGTARTITALVTRAIARVRSKCASMPLPQAVHGRSATTAQHDRHCAVGAQHRPRPNRRGAEVRDGTRETRSMKQLLPNRGATTKIEVN